MYTCDHCRDQIWDELFGLLEVDESAHLHHHLVTCRACQGEMTIARAQHRLVAEAARLDVAIPLFTAPAAEPTPPSLRPARPESQVVVRRVRALPWLATAAAILLVIGLPLGVYEYGRHRYEVAWRAAEAKVAQIDFQRRTLLVQAEAERDHLLQTVAAKHLRLQVIGPAAYQVAAANPYRVWVTDTAGHPVDAPVTAQLLDVSQAVAVETKKAEGKGEWLVSLPANLPLGPDRRPRLELAVRDARDAAPVQTALPVLEAAYRTHLSLDKPVYQAGDTIFFRSLTLQRFGLTIPNREFTAIYTLADAQGKVLKTLPGRTHKDGLGGGDFEIAPQWLPGEYTLTIAEAEQRFPPVTRRFWIGPSGVRGHGKSEPLPRTLEVEFFPEGGDLVADVDNRVYFRVRTASGLPADLQGTLVDSKGQEVVVPVQTAGPHRGLGMFTLRPRVGETYQLRIQSPQGVAVRASLPPVQATGLALSLPAAVVGPEEPIRTVLQHTGPERQLIVGLFCQGRLVAQELVTAHSGRTEVQLTPALSCSGVLRVTVFEERQGQLWPLAERLAFRRPAQRMLLSVQADKESYAPGEEVHLRIHARKESGKPELAWLLVSVVNQTALSETANAAEADLPAYFYLTSELQQPEDLDGADIWLSHSPQAAAALDLYLGTQGWRRFTEAEPKGVLVQRNAGGTGRAQESAVPAILKLDNLEQVQRSYAADWSQASADLDRALAKRDQELVQEGKERLRVAATAVEELDAYTNRAAELLRLGLGLAGLVLLAAAGILLAIAWLRLARGLAPHRQFLAGAFAALLLCGLILWGLGGGWGSANTSTDFLRIAGQRLEKRLDSVAIALPNPSHVPPSLAFSRGRPFEDTEKSFAALPPNVGSGTTEQGVTPGPTRQPPFIGIIKPGPNSKSPEPLPANKEAPAAALPIRSYVYPSSRDLASGRPAPDTILWQPNLSAGGGTAEVRFTLPAKVATYRISVQGHDANGRLGAVQEKLECRQDTK